jgi:hypothetical protein
MRGFRGAGAGVQEITQIWPGKARFYARSTGCMVWGSDLVDLLIIIKEKSSCLNE